MSAARRFWALAQFWIATAVRLRVGWVIGAGTTALVAGGTLLRELHFGAEEPAFLIDYATGVLALGGALLAALAGPALVFEGLRSRTTSVLCVQGAGRGRIVAAQILAVGVTLGWLLAIALVATTAMLLRAGHGAVANDAAHALARTGGPLLVLAAAGVFFATLVRSAMLATVLTLALALSGHLAPVIAQASAHAVGAARAGWIVLGWLVPNFAVGEGVSALLATGYFVAYVLVYAALAAWVFRRHEF